MFPNRRFLLFFIVKIFLTFQNDLGLEKRSRTVQNIFHFAKFSHIGKMLSDWQNVGVKLPIFAGGPTSFRCCFRHLTKFNKNHTATFFPSHFLRALFTFYFELHWDAQYIKPLFIKSFFTNICVCFLDLKIYENPTHIGRVSAWSKTGAAIFILKIDVRKKIEQPPITNSIDSSKPSNSKSPWWARRRRSWSTLRKSSAPAKQDWESFFFCKIMLLQTQYSHIFKTCLKYAIFTIILCVLCVFFSELFFCSGSF